MNENKNANEAPMSLSKQRKLQRKKDIAKAKRNGKILKVVGYASLGLLAVLACFIVFLIVRRAVTRVTPNNKFSQGLAANGHVEGVTAKDFVNLCEYKGIKIKYDDIKLSDKDLESMIEAIQAEHAEQSTETDKAVAEKDVIVVEYKSYFEDGTEVKNGATGEKGSTITVGSSSLKDYGFDKELVGKKITSDTFTVTLEFPSTYTADPAVAGKKINYVVAIKSIKITPDFDDELVKKHYSKYAETADAYKTYLRDKAERENLETAVANYVAENTTANSYPKNYLKQVKSLIKYNDEQSYLYYQQLYAMYGLNIGTFENYVQMSIAKYDRSLDATGKDQLKAILAYQAVAEAENITADLASYRTYYIDKYSDTDEKAGETFDKSVETYGNNAMVQQFLQTKVIEFLADNAEVTGK